MIAAVVPAAGRSSRMGRPKLALPVGGRPMLERVITALRDGGASPIVVVTGPHDPALTPLARAAGAEVCEMTVATPDMRATVEHGLRWLEERCHPQADDAFLLTPADIPFLDAAAVRQLCDVWTMRSDSSILVPMRSGRRGHPALISWRHLEGIRGLDAGQGIDAYLRKYNGDLLEVPIMDGGSFHDLDNLKDFEVLRGARRPRSVDEILVD